MVVSRSGTFFAEGGEPDSDITLAREVLARHFAGEVADLQPLAGGFFSRAFGFVADGCPYVLRLNTAAHAAEGFAKDDYAGRHFASPSLPIPRSIAIGRTAEGSFAIGERVAGRTLAEHTPAERRALLPSTLDTLDAVARADVRASRGYGMWDAEGVGPYATWEGYLAAIIEDETTSYYADWHTLFRDSFLEAAVYEAVYRQMRRLLARCPETRALIHNDYWFENMLAAGGRITGVIDWANALYGDPLYEIARLAWGAGVPGWWHDDGAAFLRDRYGDAPGYAGRIACYQCHLGLDDLRFYAKTGKRTEYDLARERLLALIAATPEGE